MEITKELLKEIIHNAIVKSLKDIYKKIQMDADENSFYCGIATGLAVELYKKDLSMYSVDTNYNRAAGVDGVGKGVGVYNEEEKAVEQLPHNQFDIIVHMNGDGDIVYPENLIHLEVKKYKNRKYRKKDKKRLLSTTKFPDNLATRCLGLIINANTFTSFFNAYKSNVFFAERAKQIDAKLNLIEQANREIFRQYEIDYSKTNEWFSNIIAGYQLGAFIDIHLDKIIITYYYSGEEWCEETITFESMRQ